MGAARPRAEDGAIAVDLRARTAGATGPASWRVVVLHERRIAWRAHRAVPARAACACAGPCRTTPARRPSPPGPPRREAGPASPGWTSRPEGRRTKVRLRPRPAPGHRRSRAASGRRRGLHGGERCARRPERSWPRPWHSGPWSRPRRWRAAATTTPAGIAAAAETAPTCGAPAPARGRARPRSRSAARTAGVEVEFEVDQNRVGVPWRVVLAVNGREVVRRTVRTTAPSGSFEVRHVGAGAAGGRVSAGRDPSSPGARRAAPRRPSQRR